MEHDPAADRARAVRRGAGTLVVVGEDGIFQHMARFAGVELVA